MGKTGLDSLPTTHARSQVSAGAGPANSCVPFSTRGIFEVCMGAVVTRIPVRESGATSD